MCTWIPCKMCNSVTFYFISHFCQWGIVRVCIGLGVQTSWRRHEDDLRTTCGSFWRRLCFVLKTFLLRSGDVFAWSPETFSPRHGDVLRTFWLWSLGRPIEVLVVFILLRIFGSKDVLVWSWAWKREDVMKTSSDPQMVHWVSLSGSR